MHAARNINVTATDNTNTPKEKTSNKVNKGSQKVVKQIALGVNESNVKANTNNYSAPKQRVQNRQGFNNSNRTCFTCGKFGHMARHCKSKTECTYCHKNGHSADICYSRLKDERIRNNYQRPNNVNSSFVPTCTYCHYKGHLYPQCRLRMRDTEMRNGGSPHNPVLTCGYCGYHGHSAFVCFRRKHDEAIKDGENARIDEMSKNLPGAQS